MKTIFRIIIIITIIGTVVFSCDKNFDELNTSKTDATSIDAVFILNNAIINISNNTLFYEIGIVQQVVTPFSGILAGANYNQDNRNSTQNNWQKYFRTVVRHTRDVIILTEDDNERENLQNMARIIQAYGFMVLTDSYGAIPYTEGGNGYYTGNFFPSYESQESIYKDLIFELEDAVSKLSDSKPTPSGEILYGGDINKWRKFGNSLLLRAGMRLSKIAPMEAERIVQSAYENGVILDNEDNAVIRHTNDYRNPIGSMLNGGEAANFYLAKPFVDSLKSNNDPRLLSISIRYVGAVSGNTQTDESADFSFSQQIGMPMGYDNGSVNSAAAADGLASFYDYSQVDRNRIAGLSTPWFIVTAGQTNLLLAEATLRDWINKDESAESFFRDGVEASLRQMEDYDKNCAIPDADINAFLNELSFSMGSEMNKINTQYWISSFLNGPEAWANFRRSGFPKLEPNPYPGREVLFINRLTYPNSEISVNNENVKKAIEMQGPDNLETKVWWDN